MSLIEEKCSDELYNPFRSLYNFIKSTSPQELSDIEVLGIMESLNHRGSLCDYAKDEIFGTLLCDTGKYPKKIKPAIIVDVEDLLELIK